MQVNFPEHQIIAKSLSISLHYFSVPHLSDLDKKFHNQLKELLKQFSVATSATLITIDTHTLTDIMSSLVMTHIIAKGINTTKENHDYHLALNECTDLLTQITGHDSRAFVQHVINTTKQYFK